MEEAIIGHAGNGTGLGSQSDLPAVIRRGSSGAGLLRNYRITGSLRNERRNWAIGIEGPTAGGEIRQGVPVLLLAAHQDG